MRRTLNVRLLLVLVVSVTLVGIVVHVWHGFQLRQNAHRLLERADRAMNEKQYDDAQTYYAQYLSFVPNDVDTVQKYAEAMDLSAEGGERVKLILLMEQVLRSKPNEQALRFRLVHNLIALDRVTEATDNLRKLQTTWPDKAEILHMLGWSHEANKEYDQAVQALDGATKINPKLLKSYRLLAEVLQDRLNQPAEALKTMNAMVDANVDSHDAYLTRARFHRQRGNDNAAENDLRAAYARKPELPAVVLEIADAARAKGDFTEAERLLLEGIKLHPKVPGYYKLLADVKIRTKRDVEAIAILEAGLKESPRSNELSVLLIDLMIDQGQYAEARTRIDALLKAGLTPTLPNYLSARLHIADKQWNEAISLLETVRRDLSPASEWNSRVHVLLGLSYRQIGDHEQELQAFRRAVQSDPTWVTANVGLAEALLGNGRIEEASQVLEPLESAKHLPLGYWVLLSRCRLYVQMRSPESDRRWDSIEAALKRAAQDDPQGIAPQLMRAELLTARKDYAKAQGVLNEARAAQPDKVAVWCALAELAVLQKNFDEAEKILDQASQQPGLRDAIELRLAQGRLRGLRARADDLAKLARLSDLGNTAYSIDQRTRLLREIADTWYRLGAWDRAEALLRELARTLPKDLRSRAALVDLALQKHQPADARKWRDEMRVIEGETGWLWRFADAALLVHEAQGRRSQLASARKQLQELDRLQKHSPRIALLLGTIDELEGNHQQAIEQYTRALDRGETQPRVLARVLELLMQRREYSKAETELAKYEQRLPLTRDLARLGAEVALGMRDKQYAKLALKRAEQAVTLPTGDYRETLWLARICQAAGETVRAEMLIRDSLDKAGHAPDTWVAWMDHLAQSNQREAALKDLERMKKEMPTARQALTLARCYDALHMQEHADRTYAEALRDRPADFSVLAYAADFYRRADRVDQAQKCYERLLDPASGRPAPAESALAARRHLAVLLAQGGQLAKALALLDDNKQTQGDTIADGRIRFFVQGQTESARESAIGKFQDSLGLQLPTPDERILLAQMLEAAGNPGQARTQLAAAVNEQPSPQFLVRFARLLIHMGEMTEAERTVTRLETLEPNSARVRDLRKAMTRAN